MRAEPLDDAPPEVGLPARFLALGTPDTALASLSVRSASGGPPRYAASSAGADSLSNSAIVHFNRLGS